MPMDGHERVLPLPGQVPLLPPGRPRSPSHTHTVERFAFLQGLYEELEHQRDRHLHVVAELAAAQGLVELTEHTLALTRDHLRAMLSQTDEEVPADWQEVLDELRFVGAKLGDACVEILRKYESLTTQQIVDELNSGQFRFRTNTPLKEVTGALLRQPRIKREGDRWVYKTANKEERGEVA